MQDAHRRGIEHGMDVVAGDGQPLGTVVDVLVSEPGSGPESGVILVRSTGENGRHWSIPFSAIRAVEGERVVLDVDSDEASRVAGAANLETRP